MFLQPPPPPLRDFPQPHGRQPAAWFSFLAWCLIGMVASPAFASDAAIFVVDDGAPFKEITEAELTSQVPGANGRILALTPTGRGGLIDLGEVKIYQPSAEFFEHGSDSFHFEAALEGGGSVWSTAFFAVDLRGDGSLTLPLDDPEELNKMSVVNEGAIRVNDVQPIRGAYDLAFQLLPGKEAFVTFSLPADDRGNGPAGGALGGGIDPGDPYWGTHGELVIAAAEDESSSELARVVLIRGDDGVSIAGEVRTTSGFARTSTIPVSAGESWELQWWSPTAAGSRDGGAVLILDGPTTHGSTTALLTGLDLPPEARPATWSFGALSNSGLNGTLRLDDLRGEAALTIPSLAPIFADHFAAAATVWSGGECGESGPPEASHGELKLWADPAADCFKAQTFDQPQGQLRARLGLDLTAAVIGRGGWVSVLEGLRGDARELDLRVRRSQNGQLGIEVISASRGDIASDLGWSAIPESGEVLVEVHWWAASSPLAADGGLRFSVDGDLVAEWLGLGASVQGLHELRLGAMGATPGTTGVIVFDAIESWR